MADALGQCGGDAHVHRADRQHTVVVEQFVHHAVDIEPGLVVASDEIQHQRILAIGHEAEVGVVDHLAIGQAHGVAAAGLQLAAIETAEVATHHVELDTAVLAHRKAVAAALAQSRQRIARSRNRQAEVLGQVPVPAHFKRAAPGRPQLLLRHRGRSRLVAAPGIGRAGDGRQEDRGERCGKYMCLHWIDYPQVDWRSRSRSHELVAGDRGAWPPKAACTTDKRWKIALGHIDVLLRRAILRQRWAGTSPHGRPRPSRAAVSGPPPRSRCGRCGRRC